VSDPAQRDTGWTPAHRTSLYEAPPTAALQDLKKALSGPAATGSQSTLHLLLDPGPLYM
jgi:hypothetical protein